MTLTSSSTFNVQDSALESAEVAGTVQAPVGFGTGGKGRLVHPTLGTYDYPIAPTDTVNVDGDVCFPPSWVTAPTLAGGAVTLWEGNMRDAQVIERWAEGDVGCSVAHLRALWALFANPPDPEDLVEADRFVVWTPSYANANSYKVALVAVRSGGEEYKLDRRLAEYGYAPQPVELVLRVIDYFGA